MKRKIKCDVCGERLHVNSGNVYEVREECGALSALTEARKIYSATDCPYCSCQKVLGQRLSRIEKEEGEE